MSADFADPDIELMLRFQKGDVRCFEELVKKHTRGVLNLVYRYLGVFERKQNVTSPFDIVGMPSASSRYQPV